jgi:phosphodiesterase/alkaline phosphatase D-like protein
MCTVRRFTLTGLACAVGFLVLSAAPALAVAPEVPATREAKEVRGTSVVLHGELNPRAADLESEEYEFVYAQAPAGCTEGFVAPAPPALPGKALGALGEPVSEPVTNLEPNREYNFCVVALHEGEPAYGSQLSFKTSAAKPEIVPASEKVSGVTPFEAILEAQVNAENEETTVYFQYSTSSAVNGSGSLVTPTQAPVVPGFAVGSYFGDGGVGYGTGDQLTPNTTYYYQAVAVNTTGTTDGEVESFKTPALTVPSVESEHASSVTSTGAILEAQIDTGYQITKYSFEYSTKESSGVLQSPITVKGTSRLSAAGPGQTASVPTGTVLAPSTTYYYRVVTVNNTGIETGAVQSFTTVPTPSAVTIDALTGTTVTFEGTLGPLNEHVATKYYFEYNQGTECAGPRTEPEGEAGTGTGTEAKETANVTDLQPDAEYTVCFVTVNEFGSQEGAPVHFLTPAAPPKIDGQGDTPIVTPFEAMLEAQIDPDGQTTTYKFEYAEHESVGVLVPPITTITASKALAAGISDQSAVAIAEHLTPGETYYYRVVAENGTLPASEGTVQSFSTPPKEAPEIQGESVSNVTQTATTLEAQIEPHYQETPYVFEYAEHESEVLEHTGKTVSGTVPAGSVAEILAGTSNHLASAQASGLQPNTRYFYRVVAHNATGSAVQTLTVASFTTSSVPRAGTSAASTPTATSVTLAGTVNPDGLPTSYYFQYGGTTAYGHQTAPGETAAGTSTVPVTTPLTGLEPGRVYHYRIIATNTNSNGEQQTAYGQDETFTTPSTPPVLSGVSVSRVTQSSVTIAATLEAQGLPTRWELQLGSTPGMLADQASGNTTGTTPLNLNIGSLTPGTTYYYKLVASNPDGTIEPEGSFTTAPGPTTPAPTGLPALIPYQTITELNAKEALEDKKNPNPAIAKTLTRAQKLSKALKACTRDKSKTTRAKCIKQADKRYGRQKKKK